jgi:dipeptidyl aminopeptidase/acylaminoacyl peptidase
MTMTMRMMLAAGCMLAVFASGQAQAANLLDWLAAGRSGTQPAAPADAARLVTLEPDENEMYPEVSPDGKHLLAAVVHGGKQVWVSRRLAENGDPLNVVTDDARAVGSVRWHGAGAVSFLSLRAGSPGLWTRAADGKGLVRRVAELTPDLAQPQLLADGGVLAVRVRPAARSGARGASDGFDNWSFAGAGSDIVRVEASGSAHVLAQGANPALSPDGQWIAFTMAAGRSRHLFLMRIDGGSLMQLTDARSIDVQPAWSPDGRWIVFTSNRADADMRHPGKGNWDIWAVDREGRNLTQLTRDAARDGAPSVAPDGTVYFHSEREIGKPEAEAHQIRRATRGFHVWRVAFPAPENAAH